MITGYIQAAMRRAKYEILSDGTYYGEIPGFQGVYANAATLEDCRKELQEVLYPVYPGTFDLAAWEIEGEWCRPQLPKCHKFYMRAAL